MGVWTAAGPVDAETERAIIATCQKSSRRVFASFYVVHPSPLVARCVNISPHVSLPTNLEAKGNESELRRDFYDILPITPVVGLKRILKDVFVKWASSPQTALCKAASLPTHCNARQGSAGDPKPRGWRLAGGFRLLELLYQTTTVSLSTEHHY